MSILNNPTINQLDIDLVGFFFNAKAAVLESAEDHVSGMFSTQVKLKEFKEQLLNFINSYKNQNSIFYIFLGEPAEQNLKIVVSTVSKEPNEMTKRFSVIIDEDLSNMNVSQLSLSERILTINVQ